MSEQLADGWADGWYRWKYADEWQGLTYINGGRVGGGSGHTVAYLLEDGDEFEPVVILAVPEHAALLAEVEALREQVARLQGEAGGNTMNQATIDTIRAALTEKRAELERTIELYSKLNETGQITKGEIPIWEKAQSRVVAIDAALAELEAMRDTRGGWEPVVDGEYDMDDGNVYKLDAGRKLLRYENGYYCGSMQLPRGWRLFQQQIKQEE